MVASSLYGPILKPHIRHRFLFGSEAEGLSYHPKSLSQTMQLNAFWLDLGQVEGGAR